MKASFYLIAVLIIMHSCTNEKTDGSLSASLTNIKDSTQLSVIDLEKGQVLYKAIVYSGKFYYKFNFPEPKLVGIWGNDPKYQKDRLTLWLENSDINIKGNYEYLINAKVTGSKSNIVFLKFDSICKEYNNKFTRLKILQSVTSNKRVLDSIASASDQVLDLYRKAKMSFYSGAIQSKVALFYLYRQTIQFDFDSYPINVLSKTDIASLYQLLTEDIKNSSYGKTIKEYISLPETPKEGDRFIDILQQTPEGNTTSISQNLGKLTILEFWASECAPCRADHPALIKLYKKYHSRGLNIIGISSDQNKEYWINAIKKDSIPWVNISDLKGFNNVAFMIYGIKFIPQLILIDQNGIVVDNKLGSKFPHEIVIEMILKQNGL